MLCGTDPLKEGWTAGLCTHQNFSLNLRHFYILFYASNILVFARLILLLMFLMTLAHSSFFPCVLCVFTVSEILPEGIP